MSGMKWYAVVSLCARFNKETNANISDARLGFFKCTSKEEAIGNAYIQSLKDCPQNNGWKNLDIFAEECPTNVTP